MRLYPPEQILFMLGEGPVRIEAATAGLTASGLHAAPAAGEWSANEVLAHLRACADVWGDAIAAILAEDRPRLKAVNPRTWMAQTDYPRQKFRTSLPAYAAQRAEQVRLLKSLPPESWAREATVTGAGRPLVRTVHSYADGLARHEQAHLKQIERIARALRS